MGQKTRKPGRATWPFAAQKVQTNGKIVTDPADVSGMQYKRLAGLRAASFYNMRAFDRVSGGAWARQNRAPDGPSNGALNVANALDGGVPVKSF